MKPEPAPIRFTLNGQPVTLEAPAGRLCAVGGGELVLVVVAEAAVNVGLVRVELLKAVDALVAAGGDL